MKWESIVKIVDDLIFLGLADRHFLNFVILIGEFLKFSIDGDL